MNSLNQAMKPAPIILLTALVLCSAIGVGYGAEAEPRLVLDPAGHTALVRKVLFTSGGDRLVSCSEDKCIKVWDIASGNCVKTFRGHQGPASEGMIYAMALSPGDRYLAAGGWMKGISYGDPGLGSVRLYDFTRGRIAALLRGHVSVVLNLAFSPDGRFLASASADKTVKVWDLATRRELHTLRYHGANVYGLAVSPDSSRIASSAVDGTIALWESRTGRLIKAVKGHDKAAIRVAFSPAAGTLASASHDGTVKLWNGTTLDFVDTVHTTTGHYTQEIAFSPDGKTLACGGAALMHRDGVHYRPVFLIDLGTKTIKRTYVAHTNTVQSICWSPDGRLLASTGDDDHAVHVYRSDSLARVNIFRGEGRTVYAVGLSPDGKKLYFGNRPDADKTGMRPLEKSISLEDFSIGRFTVPPHALRSLRSLYSNNFKFDGGLFNRIITVNGKKVMLPNEFDGIWSYTFTPDGRYAIVGSNFSMYRIDAASGSITGEFRGHNGPVTDLCVSPDSKFVYSAGSDQTIRIWPMDNFTGTHEFWDIKILGAHWTGFINSHYRNIDVSNQAGMRLLYNSIRRDFPHYEHVEMLVKSFPHTRPVASIFVSNDDGFIMWTPDFHYFGDKRLYKHVGWLINQGEDREGRYYTFDQFDLKYNRPDILLGRLKTVSPGTISGYREMYLRRLRRYGFSEKSLSGEMHVPDLSISAEGPLVKNGAAQGSVRLKIRARDGKSALDRINIYHNRVPLYGPGGIGIRNKNTREHDVEVTVPLISGRNQLQAEAVNVRGARSLLETIQVHADLPRLKPDLYIATAGISTYRNSLPEKIDADDFTRDIMPRAGDAEKSVLLNCYVQKKQDYVLKSGVTREMLDRVDAILGPLGYSMNLKYADKDAADIVAAYRECALFNKVHELRLDNEKGVADGLSKVGRFFSRAGTGDMVLLFVAGHGLRDGSGNYYFATHDIDFDNPRPRGYLFDQITALLDGAPSLTRLLLVDTCFSGEADSAANSNTADVKTKSGRGLVRTRVVGSRGSRAFAAVSARPDYLKNSIFADIRNSTGATVITSSGGSETSFEGVDDEGRTIRNGIFTHSYLSGVRKYRCDSNRDGKVQISEITRWVYDMVRELTGGRQNPTLRKENVEFDYTVY
jgi:WD40 repeat protein